MPKGKGEEKVQNSKWSLFMLWVSIWRQQYPELRVDVDLFNAACLVFFVYSKNAVADTHNLCKFRTLSQGRDQGHILRAVVDLRVSLALSLAPLVDFRRLRQPMML